MIIDVAVLIFLSIAFFKGWNKGAIASFFSLLAFMIGLAAALKLSSLVAKKLSTHISNLSYLLPFISFLAVFIITAFLVRLGGKLIERSVSPVIPAWPNRIAGAAAYIAVYALILSALLFFAENLRMIREPSIKSSVTYPYIRPIVFELNEKYGTILPWFKNTFHDLELFFEQFSNKINQN